MNKTRTIQPLWTVPNDGSHYTNPVLEATARTLADRMKEDHEKIQSIETTGLNGKMPDIVNGRLIDPVAEKVWICSALVVLESVDPMSDS